MKECLYYIKLEDDTVRCELCPHHCLMKPGNRGLCRSRVNHEGRLYSEASGHPCALAIDPIALYHFHLGEECLSLACTGCNLRCKGCQNHDISQIKPADTDFYQLSPEELISTARKHRQNIIAYTYTEPLTWYEYTIDCAQLAHKNGMMNVLVSAGYINEEPLRQIAPFLDAANIDLKYFNDETYRRMSGASLEPILKTLKILREHHVWLEITHLMIPSTETAEEFRSMCCWLCENGFSNTPLHLSRFFPRYQLQQGYGPTPISTLRKAKDIARLFPSNNWKCLKNILILQKRIISRI